MSICPPADFAVAPFIVIWEVTRACDLACQHCRADAQPDRSPQELTTAEGLALLDHPIRGGPSAPPACPSLALTLVREPCGESAV
jgi:hypothetical protein